MFRIFAAWLLALPLLAQVVPDLYIVHLDAEPAIVKGVDQNRARTQMVSRRAGVRASQQRLRQALPATATVLDSVELVANALIIRSSAEDAAEIRDLPGVASVTPAYEMKLNLDAMSPLHHLPEAWARVGGQANAGAGIKIGILDTGIDRNHAGFQDESLPALNGYPKVSHNIFLSMMNKKIIVARNYDSLIGRTVSLDFDDPMGHGTAVAMVAAGVSSATPKNVISGFAPKAYLGVYRVFSGTSGTGTNISFIKAVDDAVADGMDMINISAGTTPVPRLGLDSMVDALERATAAGLLIVKSAGNEGPEPYTLSSASTADSIVVGASYNSRRFGSAVKVDDTNFEGILGSGPIPNQAINGKFVDIASIDSTSLLCTRAGSGTLEGAVALIARGVCTFEDKLNNAQAGGAIGVVIFTDDRAVGGMAVGAATLPAMMIANGDGLALRKRISTGPAAATLFFTSAVIEQSSTRMASFSSRGPTVDAIIKPDITAVGTSVQTATQSTTKTGDLYDATGYVITSGTSFSSPATVGALAVLKSGRPGLTPAQYRSLLINSASPMIVEDGKVAPVQIGGAGLLNVDAAIRSSITLSPTSVSFGASNSNPDLSRSIQVTNVSKSDDTFEIRIESDDTAPATVETVSLQLSSGESKMVLLRFRGADLKPGEYQGFLIVRSRNFATESRLPYWAGVPDFKPATIKFWRQTTGSRINGSGDISFQMTDIAGLPVPGTFVPNITVASGDGRVSASAVALSDTFPGLWDVTVQLGPVPGNNVFRIEAGDAKLDISITSK